MPRDVEYVNVLENEPLTAGGRTTFGRNFPLAQGWYKLNLGFNLSVTTTTAAGAIAEGELLFIRDIFLKTDRGEILCNVPARALYKMAIIRTGQTPRKDAIAAVTAVYRVNIPIYFTDDLVLRPEDTILDTARYNSLQLEIRIGTVADLFGTVGDAVVVTTLDMEIERTKDPLTELAQPIFHVSYIDAPPQDASVQTFIDLDRAQDLSIKRLHTHVADGATAGESFSGANADDIIDRLSLRDHNGFIVQERIYELIQEANKEKYHLESIIAGWVVFDFVNDRSTLTALWTGDKARLQTRWDNEAGVVVNDQVTNLLEAIRTLK